MQDGPQSTIRIIASQKQDSVTLYQLEIIHNHKKYRLLTRYSKLLVVAAVLPQTHIKFPPPHHLRNLLSSLLGDQLFLNQRYRGLSDYFDAVSSHADLATNTGFLSLLVQSSEVKQQSSSEEVCEPPTPKIRGKKLEKRILPDDCLVVV